MYTEDNELYELPPTELRARLRDAVEKALDEIELDDTPVNFYAGAIEYALMARRHAVLTAAMSRFVSSARGG